MIMMVFAYRPDYESNTRSIKYKDLYHMKSIIKCIAILACSAFVTNAYARCGKAFDGIWEFSGRQGNQRSNGTFIQGGTIFLNSNTELITSYSATGTESERTILDLRWQLGKNLSAKRINNNTCELRLRNPQILKDELRAVGTRRQGRIARLTVSGNRIRMCWDHSDHDFGQCHTYRKTR